MKLKDLLNEAQQKGPFTKEPVNEGLKSNIMQKWDTTKVIERDLVDFLKSAMDASGEELVQDIQTVLKKVANLRVK